MTEQDEQWAREVAKVFISRCPDGLPGEIAGSEEWASRTLTELLVAAFAAVREQCAKVADRNVYMSEDCDEGGHFGGSSSCEYGCGKVIAGAIRGGR